MKTPNIAGALFALFVWNAHAQTANLAVAISTAQDQRKAAAISNTSSQPLTAFALWFQEKPIDSGGSVSTTSYFYDSVSNGAIQPPVQPGSTRTQSFGGGNTSTVSTLEFKAGIFQDGSS